MLNTPVLFIVFNRADTTGQVFEAIRQAKPTQLFVAADGPRPNKEGEKEKCEAVRAIATAVDWDCEVKTLFREENRGCGRGPAEAITWFFKHVEEGIILEDDCLPSQNFFRYCNELLNIYRNDERVFLISGTNIFGEHSNKSSSYFFSQYAGIWGWASWKRAWQHFDFNVPEWKNEIEMKNVLNKLPIAFRETFTIELDKIIKGELEAWDYQWWFYRLRYNSTGIIPIKNQICNIGFGEDATHTFDIKSVLSQIPIKELSFPLIHPLSIQNDKNYDGKYSRLFFERGNPIKSLLKKLFKKNE